MTEDGPRITRRVSPSWRAQVRTSGFVSAAGSWHYQKESGALVHATLGADKPSRHSDHAGQRSTPSDFWQRTLGIRLSAWPSYLPSTISPSSRRVITGAGGAGFFPLPTSQATGRALCRFRSRPHSACHEAVVAHPSGTHSVSTFVHATARELYSGNTLQSHQRAAQCLQLWCCNLHNNPLQPPVAPHIQPGSPGHLPSHGPLHLSEPLEPPQPPRHSAFLRLGTPGTAPLCA